MAVSFINAATNSNAAGGTSSSLVVNVPTNTANGDLMIAGIYHAQNTLTPPAGWTKMGASIDSGANIRAEIYYRVASSEPANYTWTISAAGIFGVAHATFRGTLTSEPIFASNTRTTADPFSGPTITLTGNGRVITYAASRGSTTTEITHSSNSGDTEAADWGNDGGATTRNGAVYYSATLSADDYARSVNIDTGTVTEGITFSIGILSSEEAADTDGTPVATVVANQPTIETTSSTENAPAGLASVTASAYNARGAQAGNAAVTVTANNVGVRSFVTNFATVTAFQPVIFSFVPGASQIIVDPRNETPDENSKFLDEIRHSHTVIAYVDLITPDNETIRLPAIEGDVKVDRTAAIRRTMSCRCIDPLGELVPDGVFSKLTPYGAEMRPYRGVIYEDGTEKVYPLGVFRISKVSVSDTTGGSPEISVEGYDRSRTVARDKFTVPYTIAEGTNLLTAIQQILERTFPELEYDTIATDLVTTSPQVYDAGDDPWEAVTALAKSMGSEIYFDTEGNITIAPPVDMDNLPSADFTYIEGQGNTMTDLDQVYSDEPGFNGVIVTGESLGDENPPVRGEAWDEQEGSVTYRLGPYGEVPMFHTDNTVTTNAEAETIALSLLANLLGFSSQLDVVATVNPTYECGQIVEVVRSRSNIDGLYAVDAFNVPLKKEGTQSLILRQKRIS